MNIEYIEVGDDYLVAKMPVTPDTHQPDGVLHGGVTAALAESVGSAASSIRANLDTHFVRGIEISANHLKSVSEDLLLLLPKPFIWEEHYNFGTSVSVMKTINWFPPAS